MDEEYVFRYKLDGVNRQISTDPLLDMIRSQLENILNVVVLVDGEREVRIDGFKLLRDRHTVHKVFLQHKEPGDSL